MLPAMLDSERPRDEWNISHVKADSQPAQPAEILQKQQVMTTHEDEFVALNNAMTDHVPTNDPDQEDNVAQIVFARNDTVQPPA